MRKRTIEFFHALDVPEPDLQILLDDNSGEQAKPKEGTNVPPEKRILRNAGEIFSNHLLAVAATKDIAEKFLECIPKQFGAVSDKEWTSIPLFKWMRREMVYASGKAFHGEVLFEQNPEWQNLLWGFDEAFPTLALNTPQWMAPRMYKLRDAYRDSVSKWYRAAIKDDDLSTPSDAPWTREWGSRFWREFVRNLIKSGFTVEGAARASLSTLWASHGNAIPSSVWLLFEILTRPPLLSEILKELVSATVSISPPGFDMNKLVKLPLLNACWQEILRLRVTALIFREVEEDMVIGKTLIERGSQIMLTNWPTHHSPNWAPFHPDPEKAPAVARFGEAANVMEFDPMRFIAAETVKADKNASKEDRARATAALQPNNFMPCTLSTTILLRSLTDAIKGEVEITSAPAASLPSKKFSSQSPCSLLALTSKSWDGRSAPRARATNLARSLTDRRVPIRRIMALVF